MTAPPGVPPFSCSRAVFLRLLAVVYLIAFASLAVQVTGLVGENGLLPVGQFLTRAHEVYGTSAYRLFPTLAWLSPTGTFLTGLCWTGVALSIALLLGIVPMLTTALLWVLYLSLAIAGQEFLQFQWDALLLETGLLAIFYSPLAWRSRLHGDAEPPPAVRWVLWGLAFKITFLSGITKFLSGDPTWANLTALTYHYETQPLPLPTGWYVHQLPASVQYWSAAAMFAVEIGAPWLALAPARFRRARQVGCALMVALQLGIGATGNYGFFNLLTIVLYLALLDDRTFDGLLRRIRGGGSNAPRNLPHTRVIGNPPYVNAIAIVIGVLSLMAVFREMDLTWGRRTALSYLWSPRLLTWVAPLDSINGYGLFRVMTTERPEIVIEVSEEGTTWKEYPFRWKPGAVTRRPPIVEPHMPRLDWQMWFAALGPESAQYWLSRLIDALLAGNEAVSGLLGTNPLSGRPRYARLAYYRYRFSTRAERAKSGAWWRRDFVGQLTGSIQR